MVFRCCNTTIKCTPCFWLMLWLICTSIVVTRGNISHMWIQHLISYLAMQKSFISDENWPRYDGISVKFLLFFFCYECLEKISSFSKRIIFILIWTKSYIRHNIFFLYSVLVYLKQNLIQNHFLVLLYSQFHEIGLWLQILVKIITLCFNQTPHSICCIHGTYLHYNSFFNIALK